jgi:hypothetical protein
MVFTVVVLKDKCGIPTEPKINSNKSCLWYMILYTGTLIQMYGIYGANILLDKSFKLNRKFNFIFLNSG